jgi:hypothetical protein
MRVASAVAETAGFGVDMAFGGLVGRETNRGIFRENVIRSPCSRQPKC